MLLLLPSLYLCNEICDRFSFLAGPVRIHSRILERGKTWARAWYILRFLDSEGSGFVECPLEEIGWLLGAAPSTLYQWLREGKEFGAFRFWQCRRGVLRVALGGLFKITELMGFLDSDRRGEKGIPPWGVAVRVPLYQLISLADWRAIATAATTQRKQQLSRYSAWRALPTQARQVYRLPQPGQFFQGEVKHRLSDDSASGSIRCLIHCGQRRVFVSKGFIPFGTNQHSIALERGCSERTVQRHLKRVGVEAKQIVQAKGAYRYVKEAIRWDSPSMAPETDISIKWGRDGEYRLTERSGRVGNLHTISVTGDRFFEYGDRTYIYRCNLYNLDLPLCKMSGRRKAYRNYTALIEKTLLRTIPSNFFDAPEGGGTVL